MRRIVLVSGWGASNKSGRLRRLASRTETYNNNNRKSHAIYVILYT